MQSQRNLVLSSSCKSDRKRVRDRKRNLNKKAEELSKLCGGDVCLVYYQRHSTVAETWPEDPALVNRIIDEYKSKRDIKDNTATSPSSETKGLEQCKATTSNSVGNLNGSNSEEEERKLLYPTWDDRFNYFPDEELIRVATTVGLKLEDTTQMSCHNGLVTPKKKTSNSVAVDHHHKVHSNLNTRAAPLCAVNGLDDTRVSRNYSSIPSMSSPVKSSGYQVQNGRINLGN